MAISASSGNFETFSVLDQLLEDILIERDSWEFAKNGNEMNFLNAKKFWLMRGLQSGIKHSNKSASVMEDLNSSEKWPIPAPSTSSTPRNLSKKMYLME